MTGNVQTTDRYVSFRGLDCAGCADRLMARVDAHLVQGDGEPRWRDYFRRTRAQQAQMRHDNLYFVGAQINTLHAYLESCGDEALLEMLAGLEHDCC